MGPPQGAVKEKEREADTSQIVPPSYWGHDVRDCNERFLFRYVCSGSLDVGTPFQNNLK